MADAAPIGINPIAFINPDFAAKQAQVAQQQALAQRLMEQGNQPDDTAKLANPGGLVVPLSPWELGAKALEKGAAGFMQQQALQGQLDAYKQLANPDPSQQGVAGALSGANATGTVGPTPQNLAVARQLSGQGASGGQQDAMPSVTGSPMSDVMWAQTSPEYFKFLAAVKTNQLTQPDAYKVALQAAGGDPEKARALLAAKAQSDASATLRGGNTVGQWQPDGTFKPTLTAPQVPDNATLNWNGGQPSVSPLAVVKPGQLPPAGQPSPFSGYTSPPTPAPAPASAGMPAPTPQGPSAQMPPAAPPAPAPNYLPVGPTETEAAKTLGSSNAKNVATVQDQANSSPMRQNVYDNILNLSQQGVATGPGQQWKNMVKGYVSNAPLLGDVSNGWKDDVTGFQELNKFLYQNAQRNWQAAGGTGTDAQLEAFTKSNPNESMNPQALQKMAQWGKASELALQAKAKMMNQFIGPNNENLAAENKFENQWNQNFDPRVYQLNLAKSNPAQMAQITAGMNAQQKQSLMQKYQWATSNGLLQ